MDQLNIADYFLDARIREGRGDRVALRTEAGTFTYHDVQSLANRFGNLIREAGCECEQRVIIALPDGPEYVGALFGVLKIGGVVVMVNPHLRADQIEAMYDYSRATVVVTHRDTRHIPNCSEKRALRQKHSCHGNTRIRCPHQRCLE